jgi:hypothetical protein
VVSVLPLDPRFEGSDPAEGDECLKAINYAARFPLEGK